MTRKSYKFRLYPNKEQAVKLNRCLFLCCDLYNGAIQERRDAWRLSRTNVSFFDQSKQIPDIRKDNPSYMSVQARVCIQVLRKVDKVFRGFFRRVKSGEKAGYPRFKAPNRFNSFVYNCTGFALRDGRLQLADIGLVKIRQHRPVDGTIKEVTVKREGSKWFAILSCDLMTPATLEPSQLRIGIDVGVESFATLSDGTHIDNWRYYESAAKHLRVAQRRVARRKKGSNRRRKAVAALRTIHRKIFNQRADFQHKVSTDLIRRYGVIAVEKLNIRRLSKGILSKQIHDVAWSSFFQKLKYKAENAGRQLIEVDPRGTSQSCTCGAVVKKDLSVRWHNCSECGLSNHRDIVSAQIILSRGLRDQDLTWAVAPCVS